MSWEEDVKILNESAAFAIEVFAKPLGIESVDQREHLTFLQEKLAETEKDSAYRYIVSRRAPMLLTAIKGALDARRLADGTLAADFERIIGVLVPGVRQDAAAVMARASE